MLASISIKQATLVAGSATYRSATGMRKTVIARADPSESGSEKVEADNGFFNEHKASMRELRNLLLEKRKELERKRVASFHQVKDSLGKTTTSLKDTLVTFAQSEIDFVGSLFPEKVKKQCKKCSGFDVDGDEFDVAHTAETAEVTPDVVDPLDAKMDPDFEPTDRK